MKVREGSVKVTVKVTWHLLISRIREAPWRFRKEYREGKGASVTFDDCYWGSAVAVQTRLGSPRRPKEVTVIPWRSREGPVKQLPYFLAGSSQVPRSDHRPQTFQICACCSMFGLLGAYPSFGHGQLSSTYREEGSAANCTTTRLTGCSAFFVILDNIDTPARSAP